MWNALWERIREVIRKMLPNKTLEQALHITPVISSAMIQQMELWDAMYRGKSPWLREPSDGDPTRITSLGLPAFIASEKARMAVLELKSTITPPTKEVTVENDVNEFTTALNQDVDRAKEVKDMQSQLFMETRHVREKSERADYLDKVYKEKVINKLRINLEYGIAKGGLVIKPYVVKRGSKPYQIEIDFIQADAFYPLAFNASGDITEAAFLQTKIDKDYTYTRIEHHILNDNSVTVRNRAFRLENNAHQDRVDGELGKEIPLTEVPEWASLQKEQEIADVDRMLFAYFKMPEANTVDPTSPLGVSGYSRAVSLIKDADVQYSRLLWEFEATEAAIDIDRDALMDTRDRWGQEHYVNPILQQRLFRLLDLNDEQTYQPYNPPIRDVSLINGLNNILMRIEDACGLSRGTLADVSQEARTATELKVLKQRTYQANTSIQNALENTLREVIEILNIYVDLYHLAEQGNYEANFEWDDSMITDADAELGKRLTLMQNGLVSKVEVRMWVFGESEEQAEAALAKVKEETREQLQENIISQVLMSKNNTNAKEQVNNDNDEMEY